jgi:Na+-translocating ferredoxin:NAD+ oxidoreductase subunit D
VSAERPFVIGPGPHVHAAESTARIMWWVNAALAPAALWGAFVFGLPAGLVMLAAIAGAVIAEAAAQRALGRPVRTVRDGSAVCTGLLLALTLPPLVAPWMAFLGAAFAIVFAKTLFGGLGFNLFNPALVGRAFMLATFPQAMTLGWAPPRAGLGLDAVTTATPLAALREQGVDAALALVGGPESPWLGLVLGFRPGSIGEVSVVLVALGGLVLVARGIIGLTIPLSILAGVLLTTAFSGAPLLHLLSGGLWLGAFFMATDYVTSPARRGGQVVFGLVIGALTGIIRQFGGYPEGICYAILLANTLVPALNQWFRPRRTQVATAGMPS